MDGDENNLNDFFKTTNIKNMNMNMEEEQSNRIKKNFDFVKGSDFYKSYYDVKLDTSMKVNYYQISLFEENDKRTIRLYSLLGESSKGTCFYNYKIVYVKDYKVSEEQLNKFVKYLNKKMENKTKDSNHIRITYKYYPVYNFKFTPPPTGNEINECYSELLY